MNRINRNNSNLEKKLGAYALAGAAMLAAPIAAKAEIQYVAVNQTITSADGPPYYLGGDPDNPSFGIFAAPEGALAAGTGNGVFAAGTSGGILSDGPSAFADGVLAKPLAFGAVIDPTESANFGKLAVLADADTTGDPSEWSLTGGDAYLGFYFDDADGDPVAGWAHLATTANGDASSFTLIDYAYETDANTSITAGEGAPEVPEPSSLALLALGGAGLLAFRHRRSASAPKN